MTTEPVIPEANANHLLWTLMDNTHYGIARTRLLEIAQYGMTKEQAQILYIIKTNGGSVTLGKIATYSMRQHHSISTLINRMERVGLVKKTKLPNEKAFRIIATTKGKAMYSKLTRESIDFVFAALTAEEKETLNGLLLKLQKASRNLLGLDRTLLLESQSQKLLEEEPD
jgi:DNA-binding MarR family transcriptional regulator